MLEQNVILLAENELVKEEIEFQLRKIKNYLKEQRQLEAQLLELKKVIKEDSKLTPREFAARYYTIEELDRKEDPRY